MRFAHIADTHIRNLKYHYEYNEVFNQLYESLKSENVDYIIHCGDIAHTKTQISPEFVEMCSRFLTRLSNIAPTYVILGNHDGNLKNADRQDAITPIVEALDNPNLHLLKEAQEVNISDSFTLNVLSVFDEDNWVKPSNADKINIALYHGAIDKSKTDLNWTLEGDHDISVFDDFDFAFLGDIHKTQILDHAGRIRYAGSTIQQNFGESLDKGYLLWDIKSKDDFSCKLFTFDNPIPFVTININSDGTLPKNIPAPQGSRIRIVSEASIPLHKMRRAVDLVKHKFKPTTVTYMNKSANKTGSVDVSTVSTNEDLRDPFIQQKLIRDYLKDYEISDEVMDSILAMNSRFNSSIEESEDVYRNVNWSIKSLEWDNLFNYGKNNKIDFNKLNGIVGVFGKNFSGKSSIIDSLLYTIYNSTSKSVRKNLNMVNQNKDYGLGTAVIQIGDKTYNIERKTDKYVKKVKGVETLEAKTDTQFTVTDAIGNVTELNGIARGQTDKNIRKYFGSLEDFLMTSMASQLDSLSFINEGSTKRKEILAKFLDLEIFEKKYKLAKEECAETKSLLKKLESVNYDELIDEHGIILEESNNKLEENQERCLSLTGDLEKVSVILAELQEKLDSAPTEIINPSKLGREISSATLKLNNLIEKNEGQKQDMLDVAAKQDKIMKFLSEFDIQVYEKKKELFAKSKEQLDGLIAQLEKASSEKTLLVSQSDKLCPSCATIVKDAAGEKQNTMSSIVSQINSIGTEQTFSEQEKASSYVERYQQVQEKQAELSERSSTLQLLIDKSNSNIVIQKTVLEKLNAKLEVYEQNKEVIEDLEGVVKQRNATKKLVDSTKKQIEQCRSNTNLLFREVGSVEQKIHTLKSDKKELQRLRSEYSAYELYMRCCHSNGISYDIIKNRLPLINEEIAKILTGIVDFEVFILNEDKKLDIFIKHPKYDPRPLEMGSGAEKTIASMAIRLALLSVTNLPKPDLFIMDEPGTALDEDNMEGFVRIIDMVKGHFKTVILISHLDALKDSVDTQITIDKVDGFAQVKI